MGREREEVRLPPFYSSHRPTCAYFFLLLLFSLEYAARASADEKEQNM